MRLTPEVLPMLQLRSCQLTLLISLAFGAILTHLQHYALTHMY
jgi:hypothetical protein